MEKMKDKIAIQLSQQETSIVDLLNPAQFMNFAYAPELFKLPVFGYQIAEGEHDFEWPTKEIWGQMNNYEQIKIKTIDITQECSACNSILKLKITLSNGQESPQFCAKEGYGEGGSHSISFDSNTQYRQFEFSKYSTNFITGIKFYNQQGQEKLRWTGHNQSWQGQQEIPDGQEIIGIYGVKDQH